MKTAILLSIIFLSISVFSQNKWPGDVIRLHAPFPVENIDFSANCYALPSSGLYSIPAREKENMQLNFDQQSVLQIYDSIYYWNWDTLNSGWNVDSREINIYYDANNNWISGLIQNWDGSAWVDYSDYNSIFDANNNEISILVKNWDGSAWLNYSHYYYVYDAYNNLINLLVQNWDGSAWLNIRQHINTFNEGNKRTLELVQKWSINGWLDDYRRIYTYDASSRMINQLSQYWFNGVWNNAYNLNNTYDANNNNIGYMAQIWDAGSWKNTGQGINTYDVNNNITSRLSQKLIGSTWVNDYQRTYTYDANNFRTSYIYIDWNDTGIKITRGDSSSYYYHTVVTGIHELKLQEESIFVYPNPGNGKFAVESNSQISGIEIYNLSGSRTYSDFKFSHQASKDFDLSNSPKGIHFLKIYNGTKCYTRKILLQ